MAKKKQEEAPRGAPEWMATFSDLMNLLLCFFVLLFSMSSVSEEKWEKIVATMTTSFSFFDGGQSFQNDGQFVGMGTAQLNFLDEYYTTMGKLSEEEGEDPDKVSQWEEKMKQDNKEETAKMLDEVSEQIDKNQLTQYFDTVSMDPGGKYVELLMDGTFLFESGSAQFQQQALPILAQVGAILRIYEGHSINIIGHTDNVNIATIQYPNNEYLASARAIAAGTYFVDACSLDENSLSYTGMGERSPIASNATKEGRAKNRRIEIRIYNSFHSTEKENGVK